MTHAKAVQLVVYNSRLGGFTNWPIEKGGRMGQEEGLAGSCTIDNIENKKVTKSENLDLNITSCGLSPDLVSCKPVPEHSPLNECGQQNVKVRKVKAFFLLLLE